MKTQQSGFTLIELVVVIVILGVLSAVALPKFFDFASDARIASLNAAKGSLAATAAMAHGKYLLTTPAPTTVTAEGATVTFSTAFASGYPKADAGFATAAGLNITDYTQVGGTAAVVAATANAPGTSATEIAFIPASVTGTTKGLTCYVKYAEPVSATAAPVITVVTTTC